MRTFRLVVIVLILCSMIWLGLYEGLSSLREADDIWQRVAAISQTVYGVSATVAVIAIFARPQWALTALLAWGISVTITATMAPIVWGESTILVGVLSGLSVVILAVLVYWGVRAHLRKPVDPGVPQGLR